jgi:hypothetical protein
MKTVEEALRTFNLDSPADTESYKELMQDSAVIYAALTIGDQPCGVNERILRALCLGIMVGISTERG